MKWNWQHAKWPSFQYERDQIVELEKTFLLNVGESFGVHHHLGEEDRDHLVVSLLGSEAVETSDIEGETLDRDSVQSSIQRHLGLQNDGRKVQPSEQGIAELMVDVFRGANDTLDQERLFRWHEMIVRGRFDLDIVGGYREHQSAMRVVSGPIHEPVIHFEAPPSKQVGAEMERFIDWFEGSRQWGALERAAIAHLWFESIHPFEDGNGRVGRALAELSLSQSTGRPLLTALSQVISKSRKKYYQELERANQTLEVTSWVRYFSETIIEAQSHSIELIRFILSKDELLRRFSGELNQRQEKALLRMYVEGLDGFKGGMSSSNYCSITGASTATATRDLSDLVEKGALVRTGRQKGVRYWLVEPSVKD